MNNAHRRELRKRNEWNLALTGLHAAEEVHAEARGNLAAASSALHQARGRRRSDKVLWLFAAGEATRCHTLSLSWRRRKAAARAEAARARQVLPWVPAAAAYAAEAASVLEQARGQHRSSKVAREHASEQEARRHARVRLARRHVTEAREVEEEARGVLERARWEYNKVKLSIPPKDPYAFTMVITSIYEQYSDDEMDGNDQAVDRLGTLGTNS